MGLLVFLGKVTTHTSAFSGPPDRQAYQRALGRGIGELLRRWEAAV